MSKTIYLLTGATGFLGSNISRALLSRGSRVRVLVLENDRAMRYVPEGAEIILGSLLDKKSLEEFFTVPEGHECIVLHCASFVSVNPEWDQRVYEVNVVGTANIIDMCLKHKVKKLVYVSSTGAIPELPAPELITEAAPCNPESVVGCYSKTKARATQLIMDAVREHDLDASIVYPSGICGPHDFSLGPFTQFVLDYAQGKMPAGIAGSFNSVDVRDLAEGVISCAEKGRKGEGYIMSNCFVSMGELFRLISEQSGAPHVKTILPVWAARAVAFFAALQSKITRRPAKLTAFSIYNLVRNNNFSCAKAKAELGYTTRPFAQTIADSVLWMRQEGMI